MTIAVPELSLVVLVGPSGSGKSTFARAHFRPTEIVSSDAFRAMLADDETDQSVSAGAFELVHLVVGKRLAAGRLTVVDATNVRPEGRKPLLDLARRHNVAAVAIVLDVPADECHARNQLRGNRTFGPGVTRRHADDLHRSLGRLEAEGFRRVFVLDSPEAVAAATVVRTPLPVNRRHLPGPFDVIGDVHGCATELRALLAKLGYTFTDDATAVPPAGRTAVFVGDLVDRGPDSPGVLRLVTNMAAAGHALCVLGNHDDKFLRWLKGGDVKPTHGLDATIAQMEREPEEFRERVRAFVAGLPSHLVLDGGKLVVAHAGLPADLHGRTGGRVRAFALYGDTTGETDAFGLPVRRNWAADYRGRATVIYGHTPVAAAEWVNRTACIDTGCAFGGALTALRYPENEFVSVPAEREYAPPKRPFLHVTTQSPPSAEGGLPPPTTAQQRADDVLDLSDVSGRRTITTRLAGPVVVRPEQAAAALEVMSRFAADPRWLVYLPPTMAPVEASALPDHLEHPAEAFAHYRTEGMPRVVCEEKHMGSRAVVLVCRDAAAAARRFGVDTGEAGAVLTRTGRRFFDAAATEAEFLAVVRDAITAAGGWGAFSTDWFLLDGELMPWSAKAGDLLRRQYAATGSAGRAALAAVITCLAAARSGADDLAPLRERFAAKADAVDRFVAAYRGYCWPVGSVSDLRFAPFALLATEGHTHLHRPHDWHLRTLGGFVAHGPPVLLATPHREVELSDPAAVEAATAWWAERTAAGGEGMVVKPLDPLASGRRGLVQPGLKVRGREYLRVIYGPDYLAPEHLDRLRRRAVGAKRGLAVREFALGAEGLDRFVAGQPLRRVHECVFAVLALESDPIDPRL